MSKWKVTRNRFLPFLFKRAPGLRPHSLENFYSPSTISSAGKFEVVCKQAPETDVVKSVPGSFIASKSFYYSYIIYFMLTMLPMAYNSGYRRADSYQHHFPPHQNGMHYYQNFHQNPHGGPPVVNVVNYHTGYTVINNYYGFPPFNEPPHGIHSNTFVLQHPFNHEQYPYLPNHYMPQYLPYNHDHGWQTPWDPPYNHNHGLQPPLDPSYNPNNGRQAPRNRPYRRNNSGQPPRNHLHNQRSTQS
jgi:hypothetical protein